MRIRGRIFDKPLLVLIALSMSCSVAFQDSVRSSSVYCSTSRFWYLSDLVIAGASAFVVSRADNPPAAYVPTAVFGGSAAIGILKRHNCVKWRETAPPEVWAAMAEAARQQAEANARAQAEAEAQRAAQAEAYRQQLLANPPPPPPDPGPSPGPVPQPLPPPPPTVNIADLCYDLDCNGSRTGKQCFKTRGEYCASLCASDNCLAKMACERNCR